MVLFLVARMLCSVIYSEEDEVREHILDHYIKGMYTAHEPELMRAGFHQDFRMIVWWEGELSTRNRDTWIEKVMSNPAPTAEKAKSYDISIPTVWVRGDAGAARVEIFRYKQHRFTDFFCLYKIRGQWQIFAKTFQYYHPDKVEPHSAQADGSAIQDLIEARYLAGFARGFNGENMRRGFHKDFRMVTWWKDKLTIKGLETWIGKIAGGSGATPEQRAKWSWDFPEVEVAGDAALAKIELSNEGHLMFTDFFLLYRFPEGWRVVEKSFEYVPKPKD